MMADLLAGFARANLAAGLAILAVMALRLPTRRAFGAQTAYVLWLLAPLAFLGALLPAAEAQTPPLQAAPAALALFAPQTPGLTMLWAAGILLALALVAAGQARFLRHARAGRAGPALVGVICPRIVTPRGYQDQFTEAERALVRAHERAHIDRGDPKVNALIALAQCLCWFNPLVHLAAYLARQDQELACDATVMRRQPRARRAYAETMLKTQLTATALPLGCHWLAGGPHPLEVRIGMLKAPTASEPRRLTGACAVAALAFGAGLAAWAAQPPAPPAEHFTPQPFLAENQHAGVYMIRLSPVEVQALSPRKPS
jgi:beta-lactamase regulating signal transducer with metallopeptidase domain